MVDIVATVGGITSNSYITYDTANTLLDSRGFTSDWTSATVPSRNQAIVWATTLLDNERWKGQRSSDLQALKWPRSGVYDTEGLLLASDDIPAFLKRATAELALALLGSDRTGDADTAGFAQIKVGELFLTTSPSDRAAIFPTFVSKLIAPYLTITSSQGGTHLSRV